MMREVIDLTGKRFGRLLVVLRSSLRTSSGGIKWVCECDCGTAVSVSGAALRRENGTRSCGCLHRESVARLGKSNKTHGGSTTPECRAWHAMKVRCHNVESDAYPDYGGRGIQVCDRWLNSFESFLEDMGPKPSPDHSIERIDNNGNYEPGNCRWATREEQANNKRSNKRFLVDGEMKTITQLAKERNILVSTLARRLSRDGLSIEEALARPNRR